MPAPVYMKSAKMRFFVTFWLILFVSFRLGASLSFRPGAASGEISERQIVLQHVLYRMRRNLLGSGPV